MRIMTTLNLVVLSSSPPGSSLTPPKTPPHAKQRASIATRSPVPLSPVHHDKDNTLGAPISGSRAVAIAEGAVRGFATAGSLVKSHHFSLEVDEPTHIPKTHTRQYSIKKDVAQQEVPKKPKKKAAKVAATPSTNGDRPKKPRTRKPKAHEDSSIIVEQPQSLEPIAASHFPNAAFESAIEPLNETAAPAAETKPKKPSKPSKPRAKKKESAVEGGKETKPKRTRTPKEKTASKGEARTAKRTTGTVSAHFADVDTGTYDGPTTVGTLGQATVSDSALGDDNIWDVPKSPKQTRENLPKQRLPDPDVSLDLGEAVIRRRDWTPPQDTESLSFGLADSPRLDSPEAIHSRSNDFTNVLSGFAYSHGEEQPPTAMPQLREETAAMRKRRIELVNIPSGKSDSRNASPKKGKAPKKKARTITDLVTGQYAPKEILSPRTSAASDFFSPQDATTKVPLNDVAGSIVKDAPKPRRKRSTSKSAASHEKTKSSKTTMKTTKPRVLSEKLLSPASAALRLNKQDILFGTSSQLALEESPETLRQLQMAMEQSEQDSVILRDAAMFQMGSPSRQWPRLGHVTGKRGLWRASTRDGDGQLLERQTLCLPEPDRTQDVSLLIDGTCDEPEPFANIDDFTPPRVIAHSTQPAIQDIIADVPLANTDATPPGDLSFDDIDNYVYDEPPQSNQQAASSSFHGINEIVPAIVIPPKAPQRRPSPAESPKRRRGRPPKSASAIPPSTPKQSLSRFIHIEEILDSEDDEALSPTPPRLSRPPDSSPLTLVPSQAPISQPRPLEGTPSISSIPCSQLGWKNIKNSIFARLTAHVRALPPTTDPFMPSWHEKMLLYDPIDLQDFTNYLTAETNIRTWRRATHKQIKAWGNATGSGDDKNKNKSHAAEGEDEDTNAFAIEQNLEVWQVREWCEHNSICCVSKEKTSTFRSVKGGNY
ncbi:hypothetical protein EJ04DRAFT_588517 [Polyplosphaeria fusca]|uniref:Structure-specific endonuclease subunit SLX4 n=1 Tax=Polyplosphaeria fusca TaxID=682080 RepID=A0A9P4QLL3_9PLEO|nr:hypothetical protein EJ04DRAFT_588517 [Polyplosphaeria fusca]